MVLQINELVQCEAFSLPAFRHTDQVPVELSHQVVELIPLIVDAPGVKVNNCGKIEGLDALVGPLNGPEIIPVWFNFWLSLAIEFDFRLSLAIRDI